jgi:RimJ/RimL family protein N-acetyltransferase
VGAIETDRLTLRAWTPADAAAFHGIWGDPEVIWWGHAPDLAASAAKLREFLGRTAGTHPLLGWRAAIERSTGSVVGNVLLQPPAFSPGDVEVGWHLARRAWGRGFATEAARALVERAFQELPVPRVVAPIRVGNDRSCRVAERLGFTRAGPLLHGGLPHDLFERRRAGVAAPSPR